jgi:hypothetical protein
MKCLSKISGEIFHGATLKMALCQMGLKESRNFKKEQWHAKDCPCVPLAVNGIQKPRIEQEQQMTLVMSAFRRKSRIHDTRDKTGYLLRVADERKVTETRRGIK